MKCLLYFIQNDTGNLRSSLKPRQAEKIESCVSGLANVTDKLRIVLDTGMGALRTAAVKPSLKPLMQGFSSTSHDINEAEFAEYEANDPFVQGNIKVLKRKLDIF